MKRIMSLCALVAAGLLSAHCESIPVIPTPPSKPDGTQGNGKITASCRTLRSGTVAPVASRRAQALTAAPAPHALTPYELSKRMLLPKSPDGGTSNAGLYVNGVVGEEVLTGSFVLLGLNSLLGDIDRLLKTASGETQKVLATLRMDVANTIDQLQSLLGDDVNHTLDKLNGMQREFVDSVDRTIPQMQNAILQVEAQTSQDALMLLREADIAAYDVLYSLPFRPQPPRVVYWSPKEYTNDGQPRLAELHGNFLNVQPPKVMLDGNATALAGATDNVTQVLLAAPAGDGPSTNAFRKIDVTYTGCEPQTCLPLQKCEPKLTSVPASTTITMKPKIRNGVSATLQPHGRTTQRASFPIAWDHLEPKCPVNEDRVNTHCLQDGWKVEGGSRSPDSSSGTCGSGVLSTSVDNGCFNVAYHLQSCNILGVCNKTARVTYGFTVPAVRDVETDFAAQRFDVPATTGRSFTFQYDRAGLPPESRLDSWKWSATITFSTGEVVNLSSAASSTSRAHGVLRDGVLSIQVDDPALRLASE